jgi:ATP-dependent RNA helicase SUPV3L1/SUV3
MKSKQNLSFPDSFPLARSLKRKIILFTGPTNSGKTYQAFNELAKYNSGAYLAPLRLLALEGHDELNKRNIKNSFITGEEKKFIEGSKFSSQTIETFNFNKLVDAVFIDEVQMLLDPDRGWAYTQALVGSPSTIIIATGSLDSVPVLQRLANILGDELEVRYLKRFNELEVKQRTLEVTQMSQYEKGSAIIAFSRGDCLKIRELFLSYNKKISVIYGNLSPEVRREEARRFREGETDFLVATDAIAMGLNLPIKTIYFYTLSKFDGNDQRVLNPQEIKQIAGRAGRFGLHEKGYVSSFKVEENYSIQHCLDMEIEGDLKPFFIKPNFEQVKTYSAKTKKPNLYNIYNKILKNLNPGVNFQLDSMSDLIRYAKMIEELLKINKTDIDLQQKFTISAMPLSLGLKYEQHEVHFLNQTLAAFHEKKPVLVRDLGIFRKDMTLNLEIEEDSQLEWIEKVVQILTCYSWLHYHFKQSFPDLDYCQHLKQECNKAIEKALKKRMIKNCQKCRKILSIFSSHPMCQDCHYNSRY